MDLMATLKAEMDRKRKAIADVEVKVFLFIGFLCVFFIDISDSRMAKRNIFVEEILSPNRSGKSWRDKSQSTLISNLKL